MAEKIISQLNYQILFILNIKRHRVLRIDKHKDLYSIHVLFFQRLKDKNLSKESPQIE